MTKKLYLIDTDTHVVVPREVTSEMTSLLVTPPEICRVVWLAMIAAAPEYPAVEVQDNDKVLLKAWNEFKSLVYGGGNIGDNGKDDGGHRLLQGQISFDAYEIIRAALTAASPTKDKT